MQRANLLFIVVACIAQSFSGSTWADVPAPPVNQIIGMDDIRFSILEQEDCRICHPGGMEDRHHLLYGQSIPPISAVPYPDTDGNGVDDPNYVCLSCHGQDFTVERDCTVCHTGRPHHMTSDAQNGVCTTCHGAVVEDMDDGHYIPPYEPSLVTPTPSDGTAEPLNSRDVAAGGCNYCHDQAPLPDPNADPPVVAVIRSNRSLHHGSGVADFAGHTNCDWCHVVTIDPATGEQEVLGAEDGVSGADRMRACENCHGPDSLHAIQVDSPNPANIGTIVVGGEDAGYGHVGRDAASGYPPAVGDSDCWGCHGFSIASAAEIGPVAPIVWGADRHVIDAGKDTAVTLTGSGFTNVGGGKLYQSDVVLTSADGTAVTLTPDSLADGTLTVTIPGSTPAGNYDLQAVKGRLASNPAVVSIVPEVTVTSATSTRRGTVIISGSGFSGHAVGSVTSLTTTKTTGWRGRRRTTTEESRVISWTDKRIVAVFARQPSRITVNSVFGKATSRVGTTRR